MTANANTKARIREYRALIKETARELKQPPTAEIVRHLVAFRMMRDAIQARLLTGTITNTDADALMKVNEVLKSFLPQGAPMDVTLNIMAPGDVTCPCGCGHRFNPRTNKTVVPPEPPPASPKPLERVAERAVGLLRRSLKGNQRRPACPRAAFTIKWSTALGHR